jgi:chemotaxis protein CheD
LTAAGVLQAFGSVTHTLHPGDVACGARGDRLVTLLGSCVAVVMTDPRRSVGAMCHIVHASPREGRHATAAHRDSAWGDVALDVMYEQLRKRGITPQLCEAYVYGGGNMFPGQFSAGHVGDSNARWTLQALAADGVRVLHHDLGGQRYRKLSWTVGPDAPEVTSVPL